ERNRLAYLAGETNASFRIKRAQNLDHTRPGIGSPYKLIKIIWIQVSSVPEGLMPLPGTKPIVSMRCKHSFFFSPEICSPPTKARVADGDPLRPGKTIKIQDRIIEGEQMNIPPNCMKSRKSFEGPFVVGRNYKPSARSHLPRSRKVVSFRQLLHWL